MRRRLALLAAVAVLLAAVPQFVAQAAPPQLSVRLETIGTDETIAGEPADFSALVTVTDENGTTQPAPGWPVELRAADGSWTTDPVISNEFGRARISVARPLAEVADIVARVAAAGCTPVDSAQVRHTWYDVILTTNPERTFQTNVDNRAVLSASLKRSNGEVVADRRVRFEVFSDPARRLLVTDTVQTAENGVATFAWTNPPGQGNEQVVVTEVVSTGTGDVVEVSHSWYQLSRLTPRPPRAAALPKPSTSGVPERPRLAPRAAPTKPASPLEVALSVPSADSRPGETLLVRVEVSLPAPAPETTPPESPSPDGQSPDPSPSNGNETGIGGGGGTDGGGGTRSAARVAPGRIPVAGVPVVLRTQDGTSVTRTTDAEGVAVLPLVRNAVGRQSLTATVAALGCTVVGNGGSHLWWQPDLVITPPTATSTVGATATATARLSRDGAPLANRELKYTVAAPSQLTYTDTRFTDSDGEIVIGPWTRLAPVIDEITVIEIGPPLPVSASATHEWVKKKRGSNPNPPTTDPPTTDPPTTDPPTTDPPTTDPPTTDPPTTDPPTTDPPTTTPPTTTPPTTTPPTPSVDTGGVARPGGDLTVSGTGCRAGQPVQVKIGTQTFGSSTAGADGSFTVRRPLPDLALGRYTITSTCGAVSGTATIDISSPETHGGRSGANGATTASFLLFFALVGNAAVRLVRGRIG